MIPILKTTTTVSRGAVNNHQRNFDDTVHRNISDKLKVELCLHFEGRVISIIDVVDSFIEVRLSERMDSEVVDSDI
jgi:hypothetical protein